MRHLGLFIFAFTLILFLTPASVEAHHGGEHKNFQKNVVVECEGKQLGPIRLLILRIFANKLYIQCITDGKIIYDNPAPDQQTKSTATPHKDTLTNNSKDEEHQANQKPATTASPTPVATVSTQPNNTKQPSQYWHPPGSHDGLNVHEHGDAPPEWANDFSQKNFGHPVMFGGDEATPNENVLKHQAYKGFLMRASGVDIYIRYHNMSNPHDRSGPFHSYEIYAKDASGKVSFWQGHEFVGYPEQRSQRMTRRNEQPGHDNENGIDWPGRGQFIVAAPDLVDWKNYLRCEQWYKHAGLWSWDVSVTICGASTYYTVDEHKTNVADMNTWHPTGDVGGSRRLEISHYGPTNPRVQGANLPTDKWFCVNKTPKENRMLGLTPTWEVGEAISGPNACPAGWLPQYISSSFPSKGIYFETGNTAEKDFDTKGVTIPN